MEILTQNIEKILEFIEHSNYIEGVSSPDAFDSSMEAFTEMLGKDVLSLQLVLETHEIMMRKLNPRIAGRLRSINVRVGHRSCPDYSLVSGLLREWFEAQTVTPVTLDNVILSHIEFEKIHPFEDGNGRIGRMIMNWQLLKAGLEPVVIHEEERHEYYKWFQKEKIDSKDWQFIQSKDEAVV